MRLFELMYRISQTRKPSAGWADPPASRSAFVILSGMTADSCFFHDAVNRASAVCPVSFAGLAAGTLYFLPA